MEREKKDQVGSVGRLENELLCEDNPPWVVATKVYMQSYDVIIVFRAWWRSGTRDGTWLDRSAVCGSAAFCFFWVSAKLTVTKSKW